MNTATAIAHPNVALIKYWGKADAERNIPAVGSLSVSLGALRTTTTVSLDPQLDRDVMILNNEEQAPSARLTACLDSLRALVGARGYLKVQSENDFPTSAGLASSASGYAALVVAGASVYGIAIDDPRLHDVARLGSGSAPRSLLGGIVQLDVDDDGTRCRQILSADDWPLAVVVAVTNEAAKSVTSRDGMGQSQQTSPFYDSWVETHARDLQSAAEHISNRDFVQLAELAEHNCLKMHSVMMTTRPSLMYWQPATLDCMHRIVEMRRQGLPVFYTIDAGPQIKAVCLPSAVAEVTKQLHEVPGVLRIIAGELGGGAALLTENG